MSFNVKYVCVFLAVGMMVLPGCTFRTTYNRHGLDNITNSSADYKKTQGDVTLLIRKLSNEDCKDVFDGRNLRTIENEIVPLQVTIRNHSAEDVTLKKKNVVLPLLNNAAVSKRLHMNTPLRSVLMLFLMPIPYVNIVSAFFYGMSSKDGNAKLDHDVDSKSVNAVSVRAGEVINTLLFVDEDGFRSEFNLTLVDDKGKSIKYEVII